MGAVTRRLVGAVLAAAVLTGTCAVGYGLGRWSQGGGDPDPATRAVVVVGHHPPAQP